LNNPVQSRYNSGVHISVFDERSPMKSVSLVVLVSLLLSGCSYTQFLPPTATIPVPTATETATVYSTPTETASVTPTQPTPTFTLTPTLVYLEGTPTSSDTPASTGTLYVVPSVTQTATMATIAPLPVSDGPFAKIELSGKQIFWGSCEPSFILVTVHVLDSVPAKKVLMFLRLEDKKSGGDSTQWGGGADMDSQGNGVFTYKLTAASFSRYHEFSNAWGEYQFIATDANLGRLGSSRLYEGDSSGLTIAPCP
jgi:hypothetical protein